MNLILKIAVVATAVFCSSAPLQAQSDEPSVEKTMEWVSGKVSYNACGSYKNEGEKHFIRKVKNNIYSIVTNRGKGAIRDSVVTTFELTDIKSISAHPKYNFIEIDFSRDVKEDLTEFNGKKSRHFETQASSVRLNVCGAPMQQRVVRALQHAADAAKAAEPF